MTTTTVRSFRMLIGGKWVDAESGKTFERRSPANRDEVVAKYPLAQPSDVAKAVADARRSFDSGVWRNMTGQQRGKVLLAIAGEIRKRAPELGTLISRETGKALSDAQGEAMGGAEEFEYYSGWATKIYGESFNYMPDALGFTLREPVGVVGMIIPWNAPWTVCCWKVAPALAAGCSIVVKPSEYATGTCLTLAECLEAAGVPAGVVNFVTGPGDPTGQALIDSNVEMLTLTGSTATGRRILHASEPNIKKVHLELGGKSANIVFPDARWKEAIEGTAWGVFRLAGCMCAAGSRVLVHRDIHDRFLKDLTDYANSIVVGDPMDKKTQIGALYTEPHLEKILGYVQSGKQEGAVVACGGERLNGDKLGKGNFMRPTVLAKVNNKMRIEQEEIFGPVISVIPFKDEAEALAIANDTPYGLSGSIWTQNLDTAIRVARGLRTGQVVVNRQTGSYVWQMPFGGYKQSGLGRERGFAGIEMYTEIKSVHIKLG
ncbi:MAG: aldehyde dehydrogenase [Chloroflexi bacterium]|nr:aldehyde dehydrogenase [Chloroflexota bacterium]